MTNNLKENTPTPLLPRSDIHHPGLVVNASLCIKYHWRTKRAKPKFVRIRSKETVIKSKNNIKHFLVILRKRVTRGTNCWRLDKPPNNEPTADVLHLQERQGESHCDDKKNDQSSSQFHCGSVRIVAVDSKVAVGHALSVAPDLIAHAVSIFLSCFLSHRRELFGI